MYVYDIFTTSEQNQVLLVVNIPIEYFVHDGYGGYESVSECWVFYAVLTARVIFTAKTSLDVFSLSQEQVWTFSVLGDRIYEMRCTFVAVGLNARFIVLPH